MLIGCSSPTLQKAPVADRDQAPVATPAPARQFAGPTKSRWVSVDWDTLPGFNDDSLYEAWVAWVRSCERPAEPFIKLCVDVRRLSIADAATQRAWMLNRLQPHRVESQQGDAQGLLTGYFEPALNASRLPTAAYKFPLYQIPINLGKRKPWFTRQEAQTVPEAKEALNNRVIAYLESPVDVQVLQIQGSGQLRFTQDNGSVRQVRLAYAGSNDHTYRSIGKWLLERGLVRDASWAGIKAWLAQNPQREQELLGVNPRLVFFRELPESDQDALGGPVGAQGVVLTAGRSIAVDAGSIPYGAPVWLSSQGAAGTFNKLVLAQDTGHAISGAVRADYFVGSGPVAGDSAGRIRQALQMWVLWPK